MIFSPQMIPLLSRRVAQSPVCRAAALTTSRGFAAAVQVEHGRGQWKTFGDIEQYQPGKYQIKCFNKISPVGLAQFPEEEYDIRGDKQESPNAHAILLRSHKLQEEEVPKTVRAIAR